MLISLLDGVREAVEGRDLDFAKVAALVGHAKEIHYSTVRIADNVLQIEEALEEEQLYDMLITLRSYIILYAEWELGRDWWSVVDSIKMATGVVCGPTTANSDSKQEYYRKTTNTPSKYMGQFSVDQGSAANDLWRNNDWLAVLWLLSYLPIRWLEKQK